MKSFEEFLAEEEQLEEGIIRTGAMRLMVRSHANTAMKLSERSGAGRRR